MTTWTYIEPLRAEQLPYFVELGVAVPKLARNNRAPNEGDVATAYRELAPPEGELVVDYYPADDGELTIGTRGVERQILAFALLLAKRCGQMYVSPFPLDALPGAIVDPSDDLAKVVSRLDPDTRASIEPELRKIAKAPQKAKPKAKANPKARAPKANAQPKARARKAKPKSTRIKR